MGKRLMELAPWLGMLGVFIMLLGLGWDGVLHAQDRALAGQEGIFTLTNPGHLLFVAGLALCLLTAVYYLIGLAQTRFLSSPRNRALSWTAATGLVVVAIGSLTLTLGTNAAHDEHAQTPLQAQATTNPANPAPTSGHAVQGAVSSAPSGTVTPVPGCLFEPIDLSKYGGAAFLPPPVITSVNGVVSATLSVTYTNPATTKIADCPVTLRSYGGKLIGPTLRVKQGETISVHLQNALPTNSPVPQHQDMDIPHDFNTTNLHTHGLHVSPVGNSDNVLLEIIPGEDFLFEIKVPPDHPVGTYWYHPHVHGSTAIQVSSSMEGALIIEPRDDRDKSDTPVLEDVPEIKAAQEQIMVFQQIPYDETGAIETYGNLPLPLPANTFAQFGPCSWEPMFREHMINGQLYPTLKMAPGEVQRWRFIHAGVRETISVELHGPDTSTPVSGTTTITNAMALPTTTLQEIAVDGIALGRIDSWDEVELEPGYRSDVLVKVDQPGIYYLVDGQDDTPLGSGSLTCPTNPEQPSLLARIVVEGPRKEMKLPDNAAVAGTVPFAPLVKLNPDEPISGDNNPSPIVPINSLQKVSFSVTAHNISTGPGVVFLAAEHPFGFDRVRTLQLGGVDEWILATSADSLYYAHPFHIHVNSFQLARPGPGGSRELVWKDTLLVPQDNPQYIYTQYTDYIGQFVYHCHILDHEDQGMMELLEVVP
jgi:FtsP/CotA-like multicopper oxidase with cupredoxin domain